jgi:hypothetical protein
MIDCVLLLEISMSYLINLNKKKTILKHFFITVRSSNRPMRLSFVKNAKS